MIGSTLEGAHMKKFGWILATTIALAGCGGTDSSPVPPVTSVLVTLTTGGTPVPNTPIVESTGVDTSQPSSCIPTGVLATQSTDASGQTTFAVPPSTSTGSICFTTIFTRGSTNYTYCQCMTLNLLTPTWAIGFP